MTTAPKLVIIDGHSVTYRSFYAIQILTTKDGTPTNAVYGFANTILKILDDIKPTHMLVTFDAGKHTFRNSIYAEYKAHRGQVASELKTQFPLVEKLVAAFGIKSWKEEGFESDDLIGTITKVLESTSNVEILVVTGDKDLFQIASDKTTIVYMKKGISEVEMYTPGTIAEKYGVQPLQLIDVKAFMGDTSDNIPGIEGIGEKTALRLISDFGSLDDVYANIDSLKGKLKERLEQGKENAVLSKELATIKRDVPTSMDLDDFKYDGINESELVDLFDKLEFKSLIKRLNLKGPIQVSTDINFTLVDESNIGGLVSSLGYVKSIHVEAFGENPHRAELLGIAFHTNTTSYFLPYEVAKKVPNEWKDICAWMADPLQSKYVHDLNRTRVILGKKRIGLEGVVFDTHIASYLCNPTHGTLGMHELSMEYGVSVVPSDEQVYKSFEDNRDINTVATLAVCKARAIKELVPILTQNIKEYGLGQLFNDVEMKLVDVLVSCETTGVRLDVDALRTYGNEILEKTRDLENKIHDMAGQKFNIGSSKQLSSVLFEQLDLPAIKKTKTGYSTDAEVLEMLKDKHPIVENILEYRKLSNLHSKFVDGLIGEIHKDGKIHTYYNMALTTTGRLSSQYPNMQNIPIRTEEGRNIRKFFGPSVGYDYIMAADYSQIEFRILAHMSQDLKMMQAFTDDVDIHTKTAMDVFSVSEDEVNPMMRRQAKAVNFGIIYGISDHGLAASLRIPKKQAQQFIDKYFDVYVGVRQYMEDAVQQAREKGYVSTILNRRRYLPDIKSSNFNVRKAAERMAMNTPIQGTASDIIKLAMIAIYRQFKEKGLKSRMLLQVHDELVFEVVHDELEAVNGIVRHEMENAMKLSVPLKVDIGYGKTWYDAK